MSYTASCFVSASDCSASDEDTRAGGAVDSSPPRSRDLFGTRPYRTAVTEDSYLKEVGGHNDKLGDNVNSETLCKIALCRYVWHFDLIVHIAALWVLSENAVTQ
jgi:hypothetical protein